MRQAPLTGTKRAAKRKPLGRLFGAFKTTSTRQINETRKAPGSRLWQRNYYEHVIRDEGEMHRVRQYIRDNRPKWPEDRENPNNL